MKNKFTFFIGIIAVLLFIASSLIGGFLIEDYSIVKQYISETYAIDTQYGLMLRIFGYIPSGFLLTLFSFLAAGFFEYSKLTKIGFYGIAIFYGIATIIVSIFPCDSGCNPEMLNISISQLIHNLMGFLTYILVPFFIILIGFSITESTKNKFSLLSKVLGGISFLFVCILIANPNSGYVGLYQRIIELSFLFWIVICAVTIKNKKLVYKKS